MQSIKLRSNVLVAACAVALLLGAHPALAEGGVDSEACRAALEAEAGSPAECRDTDGIECTVPERDESGFCTEVDACIQTCRPADYWAAHSGNESGGLNLGQQVLDAAGPFVICAQMIKTSEVGTLSSFLEALCVRTEGYEERELFRQLVATAMNCAISEGGRCDQILPRFIDVTFDACNSLCAGEPVEGGPSVAECTHQLACFNEGGRLIDGQCALGTCARNAGALCGSDYGDCPNAGGRSQDCVPFVDGCAVTPLCSEDAEVKAPICPAVETISSAAACRAARNNDCTLNGCN